MLSTKKVTELRKVLKQVNVKAICKAEKLRYASVYEALNGKTTNLKTLKKVVLIAREELEQRQKELDSL